MDVSDEEATSSHPFAEAIVRELWAEMGRQGIRSVRQLAARTGMSHGTLNNRMNGDSRTGVKTAFKPDELLEVCRVLGVPLREIVARAEDAMREDVG